MTDREFDFSGPPPPDFGESLRALCFDFARQPDKLWVDDARDPPDDTWQVARSAPEAVAIILDRVYEKASMKKTKKTKDKFVSWKALLRHMARRRAIAFRNRHLACCDECLKRRKNALYSPVFVFLRRSAAMHSKKLGP